MGTYTNLLMEVDFINYLLFKFSGNYSVKGNFKVVTLYPIGNFRSIYKT